MMNYICLVIWICWFFYGLFGDNQNTLRLGCIFGALVSAMSYLQKIIK